MRFLKFGIICLFLVPISSAVVIHCSLSYKTPIKRISGRAVGFGAVNPGVMIRVFDNPEVWSNDSLGFDEKRNRHTIVASESTEADGKFEFWNVPKGSYEVEFVGKEGWNPLSVFVVIDPSGSSQQLCVVMSIEGNGSLPLLLAIAS